MGKEIASGGEGEGEMRHAVSLREANFAFAWVDHSFNYPLEK